MEEQLSALLSNSRIRAALGEDLVDAFRVVRTSDAAWAADHDVDEVIQAYRWLY